jgi:hypothetical protein
MTINETAQIATNTTNVYGLGLFTPATGARTPRKRTAAVERGHRRLRLVLTCSGERKGIRWFK